MFDEWRHQRAVARVKDGTGRELKRFRIWHLLGRSLLFLHLPGAGGREQEYAIDVRHWGEQEDGEVRAHLYLDGRHLAQAKLPAAFPVPGGHIEVATSSFGLRRCHYVTTDGTERQLTPHPRSPEGRRARLDRNHPTASRWIGVVSVIMLVVGLGLNLLQVLEPISRIPPVNDLFGTFESPLQLPVWLNLTLVAAAALGSAERALRLRYSWLDSAAN
ncbi:hypothetical protein [Microlunatus speluncae]|uniref:hypothetical protein n=1 Tax=Microlunatus speluncae TaxID=2594267 RepID=UPI0014785CD3|nr:hypothetical protein [Microlunatus speluncae]